MPRRAARPAATPPEQSEHHGRGTKALGAATRERATAPVAVAAAYDDSYFARIYGGSANGHGPSQTILDRLRDARIADLVQRYAPRGRDRALLDVGCGYGWTLQRVGDSFERYGIDLSPHAVVQARELIQDATLTAADIEEGVPFPHPFEAVIAVNVLEHLRDPRGAIRRIFNYIVPGGIAVVHLPTINNVISRLIYRTTYQRDHTHVYRPSSKEVGGLFRSAGFDLVHHSHSPHIPGPLWRTLPWHPAYLAVFRRPARI